MVTKKLNRKQKNITKGSHNAQFLSLVKTSDNLFRIRFLVLDDKLRETESIATCTKYSEKQLKTLFNGKDEPAMMHTHWQVTVAKNAYNDLLTITKIQQKRFNVPKWFVESQEAWQGCKNGEAPSETKKQYLAEREKKDPKFKLTNQVRELTNRALRGEIPEDKYVKVFGCTQKQLRAHIEKTMGKGMNWNNRGSVWHLDHVKPLSSFDLTDNKELKEALHYKNLQALTIEENLAKYCNTPSLSTLETLFGK